MQAERVLLTGKGKSQRLLTNVKYNAIGFLVQLLAGIFLSPVVVHYVGIEKFGVFVMVSALTANVAFLDLGVGDTFGRFVGAAAANDDHMAMKELINAGFYFYLVLSTVIMVILYMLSAKVLDFFKISAILRNDALFVYYLGLLAFFIGFVFNIFSGVLYGLQRMDMINVITISQTIGSFVFSIATLKLGFGLRGLIIVNLITVAMVSISNMLVAMKLVPGLTVTHKQFKFAVLKKMMGIGIQLQAIRITRVLYESVNNLIIAKFLSVSIVTYYNIGNRIALYAQSLPKLLNSATLPLTAGYAAKGEEEKNYLVYAKITGYTGLLVFPLIAGSWLAADLLVTAWMGPGFELSALALRILAPGILFYVTCSPSTAVMLSNKHISKVTVLSVVGAVATLGSSIVLTKLYGLPGACLAISLSLGISSLAYHIVFGALYKKNFLRYFYEYWARPLLAITAVTVAIKLALPGLMLCTTGRIHNIVKFGELAAVLTLAYAALLWLFRCIREDDLRIILANQPKLLAFAYRMKLI